MFQPEGRSDAFGDGQSGKFGTEATSTIAPPPPSDFFSQMKNSYTIKRDSSANTPAPGNVSDLSTAASHISPVQFSSPEQPSQAPQRKPKGVNATEVHSARVNSFVARSNPTGLPSVYG